MSDLDLAGSSSAALVVDCSVIIDALIGDADVRSRALLGERPLAAPALLDYEVMSALRRLAVSGAIGVSDATEALGLFGEMEIDRHAPGLMRARIWAMRHTITTYDAAYVSLAEALGIALFTADERLAKAAAAYCEVVW
ncbi:type II toxin-antitoxin system VapC family toxin [Agromyces bauzanensis]|uniref:Ribonuclease VapC n=1 Tax=Agromyces bauzanensis TaxID=1308924 RepID=A0A917UPN6_9MICO|nr:type II toxin-antitoxin system VapC family toxin [Agromyces bauzanensis]GGJ73068.1 VapC ribonuclease [Agromyces bauzanensis]